MRGCFINTISSKLGSKEPQNRSKFYCKTLSKRYFSLLELMVGIAILLLAAGAVSLKLNGAIEKKRFTSNLERLKERLLNARLLATNMQSDWKGVLQLHNGEWIFEIYDLDESKYKVAPLQMGKLNLYWNQKKVRRLEFLFASSGEVLIEKDPKGVLFFSKKSYDMIWAFPDLFQVEEGQDGKKTGPRHPKDL